MSLSSRFDGVSSYDPFSLGVRAKREQQDLVDRWVVFMKSHDLYVVALPLLEALDAFGFLGSQVLLALEPLTRDLIGPTPGQHEKLASDTEARTQLRERLTRGRTDHG